MNRALLDAVDAALAGDWERAHGVVQEFDSPVAFRIHAVLHKIAGDAANARYWYAHGGGTYGDFSDPLEELRAIRRELAP